MASVSSSSVVASPRINGSYDVFLSFRGEDTRYDFTDHLYEKLFREGFHTFRDNEEIRKGEELKPEIEVAIKASKASVVVLSKNYANSTWCLDELCLILKQRKECNHFVVPVFYHVEPSDVRKQTGSFTIQVKASSKWTDENVNRWKAALTAFADLSGEVVCGTKKGLHLTYNPKVIGKPVAGRVCSWLSYWPIGNKLNVGDIVNVHVWRCGGFPAFQCGASLVYTDDETSGNNTGWIETVEGDLSRFQLRTGAYYLCRRDLFASMEFGFLSPGWLSNVVGTPIDDREVRGWRKTGRPKEFWKSSTEVRSVRDIIYGPATEEIYEMGMDHNMHETPEERIRRGTMERRSRREIAETTSGSAVEKTKHGRGKKVVRVKIDSSTSKSRVLKALSQVPGVESKDIDAERGILTVTGYVDPLALVQRLRRIDRTAEIITVEPLGPNENQEGTSSKLPEE